MKTDVNFSIRDSKNVIITSDERIVLAELMTRFGKAGYETSIDYARNMLSVGVNDFADSFPSLEKWRFIAKQCDQEVIDNRINQNVTHHQARLIVREYESNLGLSRAALSGFIPGNILDDHQIVGVAAASHPSVTGLCLFDEQGLGKTLQGAMAYHVCKQKGLVNRAIVFAPKNMLSEWKRDIDRFFDGKYKVAVVTGTPRQRQALLNSEADFYIANYETAKTQEASFRTLLRMRVGDSMLIVDESFYLKNESAIRTASVRRLRPDADRCIMLCGTPAPNSANDIVEQFNIADNGITFSGVKIPDDDSAKTVIAEIIQTRGVFLRRLKIDALPDLPSKTFHRVLVPLTKEQLKEYRSILHDYIGELRLLNDNGFNSQRLSFLAKRAKMLRMCTDPGGVIEDFTSTPAKQILLDSLLEDLIFRRKEKVVLWTSYTRSIDSLVVRYAKYQPVRIDGKVPDINLRKKAITRFQEDDTCSLFIGNPAAAGAGITLHRARIAIYESLPLQTAAYFQSLDRIHRRGQERPVEYIVLLAENTIETLEFNRLSNKGLKARELLGDKDPGDVTREALLKEAGEAMELLGNLNVLDVELKSS